jgi:hypothetical protein
VTDGEAGTKKTAAMRRQEMVRGGSRPTCRRVTYRGGGADGQGGLLVGSVVDGRAAIRDGARRESAPPELISSKIYFIK